MIDIPLIFIVVLCVILLWVILNKYIIYPTAVRISNYLYLFHSVSQLKPEETEQEHIRCSLVLIRYDHVVNLLAIVRKNPENTRAQIRYALDILGELRAMGYTESSLLRSALYYLKRYRKYGFHLLPPQVVDEDTIKIIDYLDLRYSKCSKIQPMQCTFWFLVANKKTKEYLQY